jgi:hypothetical protein
MTWTSNGANAEMNAGISHLVNNQHANLGSITLGDEASSADQGLDETTDRWNGAVGQVATTARSVLAPYAFSSNASPNGTAGQNFLPGYGSLGISNGEHADLRPELAPAPAGRHPSLPDSCETG